MFCVIFFFFFWWCAVAQRILGNTVLASLVQTHVITCTAWHLLIKYNSECHSQIHCKLLSSWNCKCQQQKNKNFFFFNFVLCSLFFFRLFSQQRCVCLHQSATVSR